MDRDRVAGISEIATTRRSMAPPRRAFYTKN